MLFGISIVVVWFIFAGECSEWEVDELLEPACFLPDSAREATGLAIPEHAGVTLQGCEVTLE